MAIEWVSDDPELRCTRCNGLLRHAPDCPGLELEAAWLRVGGDHNGKHARQGFEVAWCLQQQEIDKLRELLKEAAKEGFVSDSLRWRVNEALEDK